MACRRRPRYAPVLPELGWTVFFGTGGQRSRGLAGTEGCTMGPSSSQVAPFEGNGNTFGKAHIACPSPEMVKDLLIWIIMRLLEQLSY